MASLPAEASRKDRFKDALIEVLRADYDDGAWQQALARAKEVQQAREGG